MPGRVFAKLESVEVTLDYVAKKAELRAHKPFRSPRADLPEVLRADKLDYDKYREIEFRHDKALWAAEGLPFRVEFFHPGYLYQEPVHVNEFTLTHVQPIRFVQDFFNYRSLRIQKQIPTDTGYAGFKLLHPLNSQEHWDELGAFLGASYFRLLGKGQHYGQSARGLALDCGEFDRPEEFPIFTDWWLGKPHRDDDELRLYAILDSVSCVGAYSFVIRPGETTIADIEAVLFFREPKDVKAVDAQRKPIQTIGLAPLTSMFWFGAASERKFLDYRPAVHDSDGLLVRMENGEVLWRPLVNPASMRHQRFATKGIRGFGLMQRDRDFSSYEDLFNLYQQVPSVWVEPHGNWGEGEINLVELATHYEGLDNIVAFWDPKEKPKPLQPYRFAYTLYWTRETDLKLSQNKVVATRMGADPRDPQRRQFAVDFSGPKLGELTEKTPPQVIASCSSNAVIIENQLFRNPHNNSWRVMLKLEPKPDNKDPVDLRCTLKRGEEVLTETWTYHWSPP
jgi:glucans biosynthesis protein